jgi:hypothetical protein
MRAVIMEIEGSNQAGAGLPDIQQTDQHQGRRQRPLRPEPHEMPAPSKPTVCLTLRRSWSIMPATGLDKFYFVMTDVHLL